MSNEVPEGWKQTTLGTVSDITRGVSWRDENETNETTAGALQVLGIRNVQQSLKLNDTVWLTGLSQRSVASSTVRRGDILMVGSNGNPARIGNAVRIDVPGVYLYASLLFGVRPDEARVDGEFLFHLIRSTTVQQAISDTVQGSTGLANLKITVLREIPLLLPLLDEQRRIAEVLRSMDEAIGSTRVAAESARRASETMRHEFLGVNRDGDLADLPVDWVLQPLESLATVERGKFSIRPRNDPRYFGGDMPFIQTGDITAAGDYLERHTQTLNDLGVSVSRVFPAGTIMTTIAANIGDFTITSYPVACPDSVVGIEAREGTNPFWLYSVLSCFKVALDRAATQNAQKNINLQTLRPLLIPVPPPDLMAELAQTLEAAAHAARDANASCRQIERLKKVVMDDLLSGRVRVPA